MEIIRQLAFVAGKPYENGRWLKIYDPTTNIVIGEVPAMIDSEIAKCYENASSVQKMWRDIPLLERIALLEKWKEKIWLHRETLATLMVREIAKGKKAALDEITRSIAYIEYTLQEMLRLHPSCYSGDSWGYEGKMAIFEHVAKGVVLAIAPFNYPVNLAIAKIFPALVTGNSVVFKPATQGSLTGLYLAQLATLPPGVFNAVSGKGSEIGDALVTNEHINVISFTGSAAVGKTIATKAKKVDLILELGGKDPALVLEDADLDLAAAKIVKGAFSYSGQRCTAIKRVLVAAKVKSMLLAKLKGKVLQLRVGKPEDDCDITPIINSQTLKFINNLLADATQKGAKIITPYQEIAQNLLLPTIVDNVTAEMAIAWEEPFGPILPIITFNSIDEAIALANASNYGLQASVFTQDIDKAMQIAKKLDTGTVNINDLTQRGPDLFPFIGIKDSGMGTQGIRDSLLSFTRLKGIVINWKK